MFVCHAMRARLAFAQSTVLAWVGNAGFGRGGGGGAAAVSSFDVSPSPREESATRLLCGCAQHSLAAAVVHRGSQRKQVDLVDCHGGRQPACSINFNAPAARRRRERTRDEFGRVLKSLSEPTKQARHGARQSRARPACGAASGTAMARALRGGVPVRGISADHTGSRHERALRRGGARLGVGSMYVGPRACWSKLAAKTRPETMAPFEFGPGTHSQPSHLTRISAPPVSQLAPGIRPSGGAVGKRASVC